MLLYCERITAGVNTLSGQEAHHLIHALRSHIGDSVKIFDGKGAAAVGTISRIGKDKVEIAVDSIENHKPKENGRVIIAASVAKGERFDWLVSKCTELGVDRICPIIFERTIKQGSARSAERYGKLALSAAKQCERVFLPQIDVPLAFSECLKRLCEDYPAARLLFGSTRQKAGTVFEQIQGVQDYIAFVGPEGGLTADEGRMLENHGAVGVGLTETILRIETAAVAFASILCAKLR